MCGEGHADVNCAGQLAMPCTADTGTCLYTFCPERQVVPMPTPCPSKCLCYHLQDTAAMRQYSASRDQRMHQDRPMPADRQAAGKQKAADVLAQGAIVHQSSKGRPAHQGPYEAA